MATTIRYRQRTLIVFASKVEFGLNTVRIPDSLADKLKKEDFQALVMITPHEWDTEKFSLHIANTAQLDYNGHDFYLRFEPRTNVVATFPGTGMFEGGLLREALDQGYAAFVQEHSTKLSADSRSLRSGIRFGDRILERVRDYTAHLDIKDMSIRNIQDELAAHRAVLKKDYWIWEDDHPANGLGSLNCPILIQPHQLASLLSMTDEQRKEILDDK